MLVVAAVVLLTAVSPAPSAEAPASDRGAEQVVRHTAGELLTVLEQRRTEIAARPDGIYALVNRIVVPHFDFERITRYALGRYWHDADAQQRRALTDAFQRLLVGTYAKALLKYSGQRVRVLAARPGQGRDDVMVQTRIRDPGAATPLPVNYRLHRVSGDWKAYDVIISGVSLVSNYRSSFAREIQHGGVDGLIRALAAHNRVQHP
jgi:phospholipid transport system substrate-binding protein